MGDRLRHAALLIDGGRDIRRGSVELGHQRIDRFDRFEHDIAGAAHRGEARLDPPGGRLRLARKTLHFVGDDREAAPRLTRARRLDRGVEREQIGLARDRRDQIEHGGDLDDHLAERFGPVAPFQRPCADNGDAGPRFVRLAADPINRPGERSGGVGDSPRIVGALLGDRGGRHRLLFGRTGFARHGARGLAQGRPRRGQLSDRRPRRAFERLEQRIEMRGAAGAGGLLVAFALAHGISGPPRLLA